MRALKVGMAVVLLIVAAVALFSGIDGLNTGLGDPYETPRWWFFAISAVCFVFALAAVFAAVRLFRQVGRDA